MSNFNQNLENALSQDDEEFLRSLDDEPGLFVQMGSAFHGRLKYWTACRRRLPAGRQSSAPAPAPVSVPNAKSRVVRT